MNTARTATVNRITSETNIHINIKLDGSGKTKISTGYGFFDHILTLIAFWANFDLELNCSGDLHVDAHHSVEDTGLCLGSAILDALHDKVGIERTAFAKVPMDEALAEVSLDLSGRSWLEWRGSDIIPPYFAGEEKDIWREFFKSLANAARMNLHIIFLYGCNGHHLIESAAKGTGRALRDATRITSNKIQSTKGDLA